MDIIRLTPITDEMLISSNVAEADATEWTTAAVSAGNLRMVTTTANGASVATHKIYRALTSHSNKDPTLGIYTAPSGTDWEIVSSTVRWKMFDNVPQDQTANPSQIAVEIETGTNVTDIGFIALDASDMTIVMTDPDDGEVYNEFHDLTDVTGIDDYWAWMFEPVKRRTNYIVSGLPPYPNASIEIEINSGSDAKVGRVGLGQKFTLGSIQKGAQYGIRDFSVKETDENGRSILEPGNYAEIANVQIVMDAGRESAVQKVLIESRAVASIWVGSASLEGTIIFGFPVEFRVNYESHGPQWSSVSLSIEGLS